MLKLRVVGIDKWIWWREDTTGKVVKDRRRLDYGRMCEMTSCIE